MDKAPNRWSRALIPAIFIVAVLFAVSTWRLTELVPSGHDARYHFPETTRYGWMFKAAPGELANAIKSEPVRYTPLTYLAGGALLALSNFSPAAYTFTSMLFLALASASLVLLGYRFTSNPFFALLPLAVFWASPIAWEVAFSYNLEASLFAGVFGIAALFLYSDKIQGSSRTIFALFIVFAAAMSKTVLLVFVVPGVLALCVFAKGRDRWTRMLLLAALIIISGSWIIPRLLEVGPELAVDYQNPHHSHQGLFYYPWLMLAGYRGAPLFICLAFLLWRHWKDKALGWEHTVFALLFLAPLVFYSMIDTKRPWYILPAYGFISVWFLAAAAREHEKKLIRLLTGSLAVFYILLSLGNGAVALAVTTDQFIKGKPIIGLRRPFPLTGPESGVINIIKEDYEKDRRRSYAVYLTPGPFTLDRVYAGLVLSQPLFALNDRLYVADKGAMNFERFVQAAPNSSVLMALGVGWPFPPADIFLLDDPEVDLLKQRARLGELQPLFIKTGNTSLAKSQTLNTYELKSPPDGYVYFTTLEMHALGIPITDGSLSPSVYSPEIYPKPFSGSSVSLTKAMDHQELIRTIAEKKSAASNAMTNSDYGTAVDLLREILKLNPVDLDSRAMLGECLAKMNEPDYALYQWNFIFANSRVFGQKIQSISTVARLEADGLLPQGTFDTFFLAMTTEAEGDPERMYSLFSAKALLYQIKGDWNKALEVYGEMRAVLGPEQIPGVNLTQAFVLDRLGQKQKARSLLEQNLNILKPEDPVYADSALKLVELLAGQGETEKAKAMLFKAAKGSFDQNSLAGAAVHLAEALKRKKLDDQAENILKGVLVYLHGNAAARIYIELGKLAQRQGRISEAREHFKSALSGTTDSGQKEWLENVLSELKSP